MGDGRDVSGPEEAAVLRCNWQITPAILLKAFASSDRVAAKLAFDAMMQMKKIDIAAIEIAIRG